jgi:hypothetical protein
MNGHSDAIVSLLELHAGHPRVSENADDLSIVLWDLAQTHYAMLDIKRFRAAIDSILELLQQLNSSTIVLRQETPPLERTIPEPLVYAVSAIIRSLLVALRSARDALIVASESIAYCWDQFVAGDIDDLRDDLRTHELTSGFPAGGVARLDL